jgi:hypothetical protein
MVQLQTELQTNHTGWPETQGRSGVTIGDKIASVLRSIGRHQVVRDTAAPGASRYTAMLSEEPRRSR